jgi:2-polyprenyl-6-methoxyphenol hydroxylase-like FAD-dependent oxidoreductase
MMFRKQKTDVLVVGAGPVGMLTALTLAREGLAVEVLDAQWRTTARSYALALHPGSLAVLAELGLADELVGCGHHVDKLAFYEGAERRAEIRYAALGGPHPFVLVIPQQTLEDALEKRLAGHGVKVKWNHRLASLTPERDGVAARIERLGKESLGYAVANTGWVVESVHDTAASYVVGADGHSSSVRRALGIEFPVYGDTQFFGVFELSADAPASSEVPVVLDGEAVSVLWPLEDGRFRWSFQLADDWEWVPSTRKKSRLAVQIGEDTFPYLDAGRLAELIAQRAPWFDAALGDVRWSVGVRFERRLAARFGQGHAWLAGDAAHLASPVGVQSMNVGLREGHDLARRLIEILRRGGDPDLLAAYEAERAAEWRRLLGLERPATAAPGAEDWVRRHAERIPGTVPASGDDLGRLLGQLGLEL